MNTSAKNFLLLAAITAALAVLLDAFGAHGLRNQLDPGMLSVYHTAVEYHLYHALGLAVIAFAIDRFPLSSLIRSAGWLMLAGMVLFSGSLYALSLSGIGGLGAITPFGGLAFIASWTVLALGVSRAAKA